MGIVPLDPLEVACGFVFGPRRTPRPPTPAERPPGQALRDVLDDILARSLAEGPCHVAFSGGRDSSIVLAAAARVARTRGLPAPIPLTAFYPEQPSSWETEWQELVLAHLGLDEWRRFDVTTELDALGALATGALREHGAYWPPNAHSMVLFAREAGAGTLLTGGGGDELFREWYWRRASLRELARLRPRRRVLKWAAYYQLPLRVQQRVRRFDPTPVPWLSEEAQARLDVAMRSALNAEPSYTEALEAYIDSRYLECLRGTLDTFAAGEGVALVEPFYDPAVIRAVGRERPKWGFASRTQSFEHFFSDLLPPEVLRRSTKAYFTGAAWGPSARSFTASWDQRTGIDPSLVDGRRLAATWAAEVPDGRSLTLLHAAWTAAAPSAEGEPQ